MNNSQFLVDKLNHDAISLHMEHLQSLVTVNNPLILLLSPSRSDIELVQRYFPNADFYASDYFLWDINYPFPQNFVKFNIVIACNVFMYSPDPLKWFLNISNNCNYFLIQDLISRKRSNHHPFLGLDNDRVRYKFSSKGVESDFSSPFDLEIVSNLCVDFFTYSGHRNEFYEPLSLPPIHFSFLGKGLIDSDTINKPFLFIKYTSIYAHLIILYLEYQGRFCGHMPLSLIFIYAIT